MPHLANVIKKTNQKLRALSRVKHYHALKKIIDKIIFYKITIYLLSVGMDVSLENLDE